MSLDRRVSSRSTKGRQPRRYSPGGSEAEATATRKKAEAELKAAEDIAQLEEAALQWKIGLAKKKLAVERARADEELALTSGSSSSRSPSSSLQGRSGPRDRSVPAASRAPLVGASLSDVDTRLRVRTVWKSAALSDTALMDGSAPPVSLRGTPNVLRDGRSFNVAMAGRVGRSRRGSPDSSTSEAESSSESSDEADQFPSPPVVSATAVTVSPNVCSSTLAQSMGVSTLSAPTRLSTLSNTVQSTVSSGGFVMQSFTPQKSVAVMSAVGSSAVPGVSAGQPQVSGTSQNQAMSLSSVCGDGANWDSGANTGHFRKLIKPKMRKSSNLQGGHRMPSLPEAVETGVTLNPKAVPFSPLTHVASTRPHLVKPLELPKFSGKAEEYARWRQHFKRLVDDDTTTSELYKLAQLRDCCMGGRAEDIVEGILDGPGSYRAALTALDLWYGGQDRTLERQEKEILQWPKMRDTETIATFALKLRTMLVNLSACDLEPGRELYLSVTQKLPRNLLLAYFERHDDADCDIRSLSDWLMDRVLLLRRADERLKSTDAHTPQSGHNRPTHRAGQRQVHQVLATTADAGSKKDRSGCPQCSGNHNLSCCSAFAQMKVSDRWRLIKSKPDLCAVCFQFGHRGKSCQKGSCPMCHGPHHDLLHISKQGTKQESPGNKSRTEVKASKEGSAQVQAAVKPGIVESTQCGQHLAQSMTSLSKSSSSFMTVPIVFVSGDTRLPGTALLDPASSTSYIQQSVASKLKLSGPSHDLTTSVLGGRQVTASREVVHVQVESVCGGVKTEIEAWILPTVTAPLPSVQWNQNKEHWPHLRDVTFPSLESDSTDALIGLNAVQLHACLEERLCDEPGAPIARRTPLGWVCFGVSSGPNQTLVVATDGVVDQEADQHLEELVERFWKTDDPASLGTSKMTPSADDIVAEKLTAQSLIVDNGRIRVGIPWKNPDGLPQLSSNRPQAEQRLHSLERSLARRPAVNAEYQRVMANHISKGYVRLVTPEEVAQDGDRQWYLPHFPVVRQDKTTTKVRIVFDAAAQSEGKSINNEMYTGPALQNSLVEILLRFSMEPIAIVGDIAEMFLQVKLTDADQRFHRFVWRDGNGELAVYQFERLVFGIKASPYLAGRAVKETLSLYSPDFSDDVVTLLGKDLYVDDLLSSVPSENQAIEIRTQAQNLLDRGGFHMRKWISNSEKVMESIPEGDQAQSTSVTVDDDSAEGRFTVKTLGMSWDAQRDVFTFHFRQPDIQQYTKRSVLRGLATVFDPRGLISPFTVRAKVLLQDACLLAQGWDDQLPADMTNKWKKWFAELPELCNVTVPRCYKVKDLPSRSANLTVHCFTDASDRALAAAVYIRAEYPDGTTQVTLAMAKTKPAPIKRQTIPQLELRAAVLGKNISCIVADALDIPVSQHVFWTDSMNVLGWVQSHSRRFKVDVGNRISELQSVTRAHQWRHVSGRHNPADKGTRGLSAAGLCEDEVWWSGPKFLHQSPECWPEQKVAGTTELWGELKLEMTLASPTPVCPVDLGRFSTWEKLVRVTAWFLRFVKQCKGAVQRRVVTKGDVFPSHSLPGANGSTDSVCSGSAAHVTVTLPSGSSLQIDAISAVEFLAAEKCLIALAQRDAYSSTRERLLDGQSIRKSDPLVALNPKLDTASEPPLLTVNGRLPATKYMPSAARFPIILPANHRVTHLIIQQEDESCHHSVGSQHILARLRERYWIVHGTSTVKSVRSKCVSCRKNRAEPASQLMGKLPEFRVANSLQPFSRASVDYGGPYLTKQGRRVQAKRYICLFTCLETRATHLEVAYSLSTESFLMAFERFVKRRGVPRVMISDNGSNFTAAEQELREAFEAVDQDLVARCSVKRGIEWRFNPPRAPHFGGIVESQIKAAKKSLAAILKRADISDEELVTAVIQVEELMNSRPLTVVSSDADDLSPLTPMHFLAGRLDPPLALERHADEDVRVNPRKRWLVVQALVRAVWKRWVKEFVPLLNARRKWQQQRPNLAVGDIVLSLTATTPRGTWPMGKVVAVHPGPDNLVRVVDIRVGGKVYRRAVHQLVPLVEGGE